MREMRRYEIPVDDELHKFTLSGWGCYTFSAVQRNHGFVIEFWVDYDSTVPPFEVTYKVFGTGHPIGDVEHPADRFEYISTAPRHSTGLVFHVFEYSGE